MHFKYSYFRERGQIWQNSGGECQYLLNAGGGHLIWVV